LGILEYQKDLEEKVDQKVLLASGCPEEVEVRANTVQAVELIRQHLLAHDQHFKASEIDAILWHLGQNDAFRLKPYHRTPTLFY
jgi:hypothetical protein